MELVLSDMASVFQLQDTLLAAQSAVPIYFLLFREARATRKLGRLSRTKLVRFNQTRSDNRVLAETDIVKADFELLEYDRMSQQGTNNASSVRERLRILKKHLGI